MAQPSVLPDDEWCVREADVEIFEELGAGMFSKVYRGAYKGVEVAVKKLCMPAEVSEARFLAREISILKTIEHPNILRLVGVALNGLSLWILTELVANNDLEHWIANTSQDLSWKLRIMFAHEIAAALAYLHERSIMHRDLKSANVLVDKTFHVKLADFGFATVLNAPAPADDRAAARRSRVQRPMTMCGTDEFMAPELTLGESYNLSVDVFSFGIVLLELITRLNPNAEALRREARECFELNRDRVRTVVPDDCPPEFLDLAFTATEYTPAKRPSSGLLCTCLAVLFRSVPETPGWNNPEYTPPVAELFPYNKSFRRQTRTIQEIELAEAESGDLVEMGASRVSLSFAKATTTRRASLAKHAMVNAAEAKRKASPRSSTSTPRGGSPLGSPTGAPAAKATTAAAVARSPTVQELFPHDNWFINEDEVEVLEEIGTGMFSRVYRGVYKGEEVAIKKMAIPEDETTLQFLRREVEVVKQLIHRHILRFVGISATDEHGLWLLTELVPNHDLATWLSGTSTDLSWKLRARFAFQVAEAMEYLHDNSIMHRDLKPDNILVDAAFDCRLADFGFARSTEPDSSAAMTIAGTDEYMAPELTLGEPYGLPVDVFSYGIVLVELITRLKASDGRIARTPRACFELDASAVRANAQKNCPPALLELALACCNYAPSKRPTFFQIVRSMEDIYDRLPETPGWDTPKLTPVVTPLEPISTPNSRKSVARRLSVVDLEEQLSVDFVQVGGKRRYSIAVVRRYASSRRNSGQTGAAGYGATVPGPSAGSGASSTESSSSDLAAIIAHAADAPSPSQDTITRRQKRVASNFSQADVQGLATDDGSAPSKAAAASADVKPASAPSNPRAAAEPARPPRTIAGGVRGGGGRSASAAPGTTATAAASAAAAAAANGGGVDESDKKRSIKDLRAMFDAGAVDAAPAKPPAKGKLIDSRPRAGTGAPPPTGAGAAGGTAAAPAAGRR